MVSDPDPATSADDAARDWLAGRIRADFRALADAVRAEDLTPARRDELRLAYGAHADALVLLGLATGQARWAAGLAQELAECPHVGTAYRMVAAGDSEAALARYVWAGRMGDVPEPSPIAATWMTLYVKAAVAGALGIDVSLATGG